MYLQIDQMGAWDEIKQRAQLEPDWLSIGGLKGFADGSLGRAQPTSLNPTLIIQIIRACWLPRCFRKALWKKEF